MKDKNTNDHRLKALFGEALGTTPTPKETEQAWQEFMTSRRTSPHRRKNLYISIASAAAILVLAFILWPTMRTPDSTEGIQVFASLEAPKEITFSETNERMEISTPAGTTTTLTLSEGTQVLLSANSRLEYDKEFTSNKREVTLVGEARFSVAKDSKRPFIVHTEQIQTQVLGTVFDVKAYPQTTPDVTLYEGSVEVSLNGTSPKRMQPGEQASINKEGKLKLEKASTTQGNWAEGEFAFDNKELKEAMIEIGSWYNISVVFHQYHLLKERIYFRMDRSNSIDEVLGVLNDLGIAKFSMKDNRIVVESK
ncbi:MAG: FecR domain-containing protein [Bacteroidaceae bacterium]|nr:FecR domain-containing protein [Bacteroidaceae bacterium]